MKHLSHLLRKPTICICENKGADQLRKTKKLISSFVFATRIVQFLYLLNPKFPVSSHLLCLYSPVCVGPVQKAHCWFSHEADHLKMNDLLSFSFLKVFKNFGISKTRTFINNLCPKECHCFQCTDSIFHLCPKP